MTLYVLFLFIAFPLLNFAVLGVRAFFLWFACNQAVMGGSKAHTLVHKITIGSNSFNGAMAIAFTKALDVKNAFGANGSINWDTTIYPKIWIRYVPIPQISGVTPPALPASGPMSYNSSTVNSPIASIPDSNLYMCEFYAVIVGTISPFLPLPLMPWPGVGTPMTMQVDSTAQFENPPGLVE